MDAQAHFDMDSLEVLKDVMEEEFDELIALFVADSEDRLPKMEQALQQRDATTLMSLAHSFKGASGNVCALSLSHVNKQLEDRIRACDGRDPDWTLVAQDLAAVSAEYDAVRLILDKGL